MMAANEYRVTMVSMTERVQHFVEMLPAFSEMCWFMLSLLLFMVLGPFAAPVALFTIFRLDTEHRGWTEPEAAE